MIINKKFAYMHEAMFFKKGLKDEVVCGLCPHNCIINTGENGVCGTRFNHDGQLITANYGRITALNHDPIEKKPFYHFFPGQTILSVGSFGCNMRCDFCQNHNIAQAHHSIFSQYREYKPAEIINKLAELKGNIGLAYTYNEPIVWYEYMFVLGKMAKENSLKNVMVSSGYINYEVAKQHLRHVYIGNVVGCADFANTFCPACSCIVIERNGYNSEVKNADSQGRCAKCKHQVFTNT